VIVEVLTPSAGIEIGVAVICVVAGEAGPGVIAKAALVAPVRPLALAARVYPDPARVMDKLENVATPLTAATVVVPESVPPAGLVPIATVTLPVNEGTV
jgi:hypothetical protein